jgi:hypothetical protein
LMVVRHCSRHRASGLAGCRVGVASQKYAKIFTAHRPAAAGAWCLPHWRHPVAH